MLQTWSRCTAVIFSAACLAVCSIGCETGPRPDILLVTIDTLRADHTSAYGYPIETTPNLARLAAEGVLFRNAYAPTATTGPSHAALLTSVHPRALGVVKNGQRVPAEALSLAEILREEGYLTAAFVSSLPVRSRFGFDQGFDHFGETFTRQDASIGREGGNIPHDRVARATTADLRAWLSGTDDTKPVFVWLHLVDPHAPYRSPKPFRAKWPEGTKGYVRRYDQEIRYADAHLGQAIVAMRGRGRADGTLIVATSDHGEGLGNHDWHAHGMNLYEEAVRVPLVAAWTGHIKGGRVEEGRVGLMDVAPGILASVQLPIPPSFTGANMFALTDMDRPMFLQRREYRAKRVRGQLVKGTMVAVVRDGKKFIEAPGEDRREVYDLEADPGELNNLAKKDPTLVSRGQEVISAWQDATPVPAESLEGPDEDDVRALRSLGYVD